MKLLLLGVFTLVLVFIWVFFVVVSMHSRKYANFSTAINRNTNFLLAFLIILSISGYLVIIFGNFSGEPFGNFFKSDNPSSVNIDESNFQNNITY